MSTEFPTDHCLAIRCQILCFVDPPDPAYPDSPEIAELRQHLSVCPACQQEVKAERELLGTVSELAVIFPNHDQLRELEVGREERQAAFSRFLQGEINAHQRTDWRQRFRAISPETRLSLLRQVVATVLLRLSPGELPFFAPTWDAFAAGAFAATRSTSNNTDTAEAEGAAELLQPLIRLALGVNEQPDNDIQGDQVAAQPSETDLAPEVTRQFWAELERQTAQLPTAPE